MPLCLICIGEHSFYRTFATLRGMHIVDRGLECLRIRWGLSLPRNSSIFIWHALCFDAVMIEALLNSPNYQASKAILDVTAERHRVMASNLANVHTPGYQRMDIAESFRSNLQNAIKEQDPQALKGVGALEVEVVEGLAPESPDGNTVNLERELMYISQNALEFEANTQFVSGSLARLKMAITGRTS